MSIYSLPKGLLKDVLTLLEDDSQLDADEKSEELDAVDNTDTLPDSSPKDDEGDDKESGDDDNDDVDEVGDDGEPLDQPSKKREEVIIDPPMAF